MRSVRDIPVLQNIPVLVRAALNVPVENGLVVNDYRLRRAIPTIRYLCERGGRVVLISHIGEKGTETLAPVAKALQKLLPNVSFFEETVGAGARDAVRKLLPGYVLVLENLRRNRGEKENNATFARELASLADVFVEDSFDTCHRPHASIVGVPQVLPSYAGLLVEEEVRELSLARAPKHPALAVIGGAKFSTKEAVLKQLLQTYDHVFVGGALANDFIQATGHSIGKSLVSPLGTPGIEKLLANKKLVLPIDSLVIPIEKMTAPDCRAQARVASLDAIRENEIILDHGPGTATLLAELARKSKTVLWNGPLGNYENGFVDATTVLARAVAESGTHSVIGGGDTVAAIEKLGILSQFSFVSTGGGAMLDFLVKGTLPGIEALDNNSI